MERRAGAIFRPGGLALTTRLVAYLALPAGSKVVDVGCGTGVTVEYLREKLDADAIGIDASAVRVQQGRSRVPDLPLLEAPSEAMPFPDSSQAAVVAECSLSVMQDLRQVLKEFRRILMPGGKLAVTDLYIRAWQQVASRATDQFSNGIMVQEELIHLLEDYGFHILVWEDQSGYLKEFLAGYIMEHGSSEPLWQCLCRNGSRITDRSIKLGYFLLVAEKRDVKGWKLI